MGELGDEGVTGGVLGDKGVTVGVIGNERVSVGVVGFIEKRGKQRILRLENVLGFMGE